MRNQLIQFQNRWEKEFERKKSLYTGVMYFLAFLSFLASNVIALLRLPFLSLQSNRHDHHVGTGKVNLVDESSLDETIGKHPTILLMFGADW